MQRTVYEEDPATWEGEVAALEKAGPPVPGGVLFTGSSSVRCWTTMARDFAPLPVVNHGFGGAQVDAVLHFAGRLVVPWRPRIVVLYAGENDLEAWRGKDVARVLSEVRLFAGVVRGCGASPWLLSLKHSPARAADRDAVDDFNAGLVQLAKDGGHRHVDVTSVLEHEDGSARPECFLEDGLHLSPLGYAAWTSVLRPLLLAAW